MSEKKFLNEAKNHTPPPLPFKLNGRSLTQTVEKGKCKISKKNRKPNYNNPSSYPPISLNSIIGKLMERIITSRLEGYVETNDILDEEQEGFRHYRSTISVKEEDSTTISIIK